MIRVFKTDFIKRQLEPEELKCLEDDFRHYKAHGVLPDLFGRDVPYNQRSSSGLLPCLSHSKLFFAYRHFISRCSRSSAKKSGDVEPCRYG